MQANITGLMSTGSSKPIFDKPGIHDSKVLPTKIKKNKDPQTNKPTN